MKDIVFKGSAVALITPMDENCNISYNSLGELIEFHIKNSTDAIVVCGTTGESATLSEKEHKEIIKYTVEKVSGRIPVIAGTGSNNTEVAIKRSQEAQKLGADALLVVTPYYNKTSQKGLFYYYKLIAESVDIPIILYNVPSRTGCSIKPETYFELSKIPNIVAAKEASGDISNVAKIVSLCGENLSIYSGNDDQIVPVLSLGGIGVISAFANICPKETHDMVVKYLDGDTESSRKIQIKFLDLINVLFSDVNPIVVKEAVNLLGFSCGKCRMPLTSVSGDIEKNLIEVMKKHLGSGS